MKIKTILKRLKKVGPVRLIFLILLVMVNTFAWFIYATKVQSNVTVHVKAWNVVFEDGENEITDTINLTVGSIYPGMDDYEYELNVYNRSEVSASLTYQLLEATVFGTEYVTTQGRIERGEAAVATDITSSELEDILANDFPFSITFDISSSVLSVENGNEQYTLTVVWPYESNDDEEDTYWGMRSASFMDSNPNDPSISLKVKIFITQSNN